jgi:predicted DNA-binding transcriptional regulator AlpA
MTRPMRKTKPRPAVVPEGAADRWLTLPEVRGVTHLSAQTIYKLMAQGRFPASIAAGSAPCPEDIIQIDVACRPAEIPR